MTDDNARKILVVSSKKYGKIITKFNKMEYGKTDWINYRQLKKGEKILDTDEVLEDKKGWRKTICAGGLAPDPQFTSHRMYRRLKNVK